MQIVYILEIEWSIDRDEGFQEVEKQKQMSSTKASLVRS